MRSGTVWNPGKPIDPAAAVQLKQIALERQEYYGRHEIPGRAFRPNGVKFELIADVACNAMLQLRAYVWAQKLQDETVELKIETPATWWQHVKQAALASPRCPAWFYRFITQRWPVRLATKRTSYRFKTLALLPGFKYEAPDRCGEALVISTLERA